MNSLYLRFAAVWLVSVGAGCTSAPVRYYTLTAPPERILPASGTSPTASETTPIIDVRIVHTPPQLNRVELMVRTGPTEVMLLENERWASPVNDEIKDALRLDLQRRLGRMTASRPAFAKLTLDIDVRRLEAEFGRYALMEASWTATLSAAGERSAMSQPSNGERVTTCLFQADEKIDAGYAGIVEGYQREIAALADAIIAVLTSPASGIDAPCQKAIEGSAGGSGPKDHLSPVRG
jgi:uncharacterized lipoprotein YmbA